MTETSRVLALVFTDLADSTALKTQRGDVAVGDLISRHREHVTTLAAQNEGRIIDWAGDGCFLTFETSSAAVTFALQLQQTHASESDLPGVRIGIHMGEITEKPGPGEAPRIEGLAVDLAARISGLAKPSQVLMSAAVYNSTRQRLDTEAFGHPLRWQAHGTYQLKGFDEPMDIREAGIEGIAPLRAPESTEKAKLVAGMATFTSPRAPRIAALAAMATLLTLIGYTVLRLSSNPEASPTTPASVLDAARPESIAVLYFENLSDPDDPENLETVMASLLTSELSFSEDLHVLPRQRLYDIGKQLEMGPDAEIDRTVATEIATLAGVGSMVVGTIVQAGQQLRVNYELIQVATAQILHAFQASGTEDEIFALAEQLGSDLRGHLQARQEPIALTERLTASVPAFKAYIRGETFLHNSKFFEADREFREATELDPDFAQAHFWRAIALSWLDKNQATHIALRAYELIDHFPPSYRQTVEAARHFFDGNWGEAYGLLNAALDADQDNKEALYFLSEIHFHSHDVGDPRKSADLMERIQRLDPEFDLILGHLATCYTVLKEEDNFSRVLERAQTTNPDGATFAAAQWAMIHGDPDAAVRILVASDGALTLGLLTRYALGTGQLELAESAHKKLGAHVGAETSILKLNNMFVPSHLGQLEQSLRASEVLTQLWNPSDGPMDGYQGEDFVTAQIERAELFDLRGDTERAQIEAARAVEAYPNSYFALFFAGHYALNNDDHVSASRFLAQARELNAAGGERYLSFFVGALEGNIALHQRDYVRARDLLVAAMETQLNAEYAPDFGRLLIEACIGLGDLAQAAAVHQNLRPSTFMGTSSTPRIRMLHQTGMLHLELGDPDAARDYFIRYLAYWGYADWDLPEVAEAKTLLAQLEDEDR